MRKIVYTLIVILSFTSCSKSIQPTTLKQEEQKQLRKNEHNKIIKIILVFNMVCILALYDLEEKFAK